MEKCLIDLWFCLNPYQLKSIHSVEEILQIFHSLHYRLLEITNSFKSLLSSGFFTLSVGLQRDFTKDNCVVIRVFGVVTLDQIAKPEIIGNLFDNILGK